MAAVITVRMAQESTICGRMQRDLVGWEGVGKPMQKDDQARGEKQVE